MNGERSQSTACRPLMAVALLTICFGCDQSTTTEANKTPVAKAAPSSAAIDTLKVLSADDCGVS